MAGRISIDGCWIYLIPRVWFIYPQHGYHTKGTSIEVKVKTEDVADAVDSVTFVVNNNDIGTAI